MDNPNETTTVSDIAPVDILTEFNFNILMASEPIVFRLKAVGKWYPCAVSTAYDSRLPVGLTGRLDAREFQLIIEDINDRVSVYWPCPLCRCFGLLFCPLTFGLSLLCPHICFSEAELVLRSKLDQANSIYFEKNGLEIVLEKHCNDSCLKIQ